MCGIVGLAGSPLARDERARIVRSMGSWLTHRGPDGWGEHHDDLVSLGHNRLAIVDIEGGAQPMSDPARRAVVVFNGEIYNAAALRRELTAAGYRFFTDHSDTETILWGYQHWGTGVFARLDGMFAIAIWDANEKTLVLSRDPMGIKPLYHASLADGTLIFGSEPKAILASRLVRAKLAEECLGEYFLFRASLHPRTLFAGIEKVQPGAFLVFDARAGTKSGARHWLTGGAGNDGRSVRWTDARLRARLEALLDESVASHLVADVPVGIFLSGGVDSSLLASRVDRRDIRAFTVSTRSPLDEASFASAVAARTGLPHEILCVEPDAFLSSMDLWTYFNDDPVADPSALALMLLSRFARTSGMKVMLAGEGADELFGGYTTYRIHLAAGMARRLRFAIPLLAPIAGLYDHRLAEALRDPGPAGYWGSAHVTDSAMRAELLGSARASVESAVRGLVTHPALPRRSPLRTALLVDQTFRLPNDILARTDRATMAYALEARVPFLSRGILEFASALPERFALGGPFAESKRILKEIAALRLPREVLYRKKRGFDLPLRAWLCGHGRDVVEERLRGRSIGALDYRAIAERYRQLAAGKRKLADLVWAWLVLESWHERWVRGGATRPVVPPEIQVAARPEP